MGLLQVLVTIIITTNQGEFVYAFLAAKIYAHLMPGLPEPGQARPNHSSLNMVNRLAHLDTGQVIIYD